MKFLLYLKICDISKFLFIASVYTFLMMTLYSSSNIVSKHRPLEEPRGPGIFVINSKVVMESAHLLFDYILDNF